MILNIIIIDDAIEDKIVVSDSKSESGSGDTDAGDSESSGANKENVGEDGDSSSSINTPLLAITLLVPFVQWLF